MSDNWNHGRSTYLKHKCRCEICVEDARIYRAKYTACTVRLQAEPFITRLTLDGRMNGVNKSVAAKWRKHGMSVFNADKWAIALGYHPVEIWGSDFYQGCEDV